MLHILQGDVGGWSFCRRDAFDPKLLIANLSVGNTVNVCISDLAGAALSEKQLPTEATISELEDLVRNDLQPEWKDITPLTDDGSELKKTDLLKDHVRLLMKGQKQKPGWVPKDAVAELAKIIADHLIDSEMR